MNPTAAPPSAALPASSAETGAQRTTTARSTTWVTHVVAFAIIAVSAGITVALCRSMLGGMAMAGGWELSMAWMPMGSQGWIEASVMFLGMWLAMMVAMMLPSALPALLLFRRTLIFRGAADAGRQTWNAGLGYFAVWLAFGAIAFAAGVVLTQAALASDAVSRVVPWLAALTLIAAGVYQLTPFKAACLKHCRGPIDAVSSHLGKGGFRLGLHHGARCAGCCLGIMLVQFVLGVMNIAAMAAIAVWIAAEKLTSLGPRLVRVGGVLAILAGVGLLVQLI